MKFSETQRNPKESFMNKECSTHGAHAHKWPNIWPWCTTACHSALPSHPLFATITPTDRINAEHTALWQNIYFIQWRFNDENTHLVTETGPQDMKMGGDIRKVMCYYLLPQGLMTALIAETFEHMIDTISQCTVLSTQKCHKPVVIGWLNHTKGSQECWYIVEQFWKWWRPSIRSDLKMLLLLSTFQSFVY